MIIGINGRAGAGKTELSNVFIANGFKRTYFAKPLKSICAEWLGLEDVAQLNRLKENGDIINVLFNQNDAVFFSKKTGISVDAIWDRVVACGDENGKLIRNVRELLQFIGTDIIRSINNDWHIEQIREEIKMSPGDYVIDDVRFPNEKALIEELNGDCWRVIRPRIDNVTNHESEVALNWTDFGNNIIINDGSLDELKEKLTTFISNYNVNKELRDFTIEEIRTGKTIDAFDIKDYLLISPYMFEYKKMYFGQCKKGKYDIHKLPNKKWYAFIIMTNPPIILDNPLNIEDFKLYL